MVVTVFDGDVREGGVAPVGWRRIAAPDRRRQENARALGRLGIEALSLGFVEAALRGTEGRPTYPAPEDLVSAISSSDSRLYVRLRALLSPLIKGAAIVYAPVAGEGAHVDHRLLRHALDPPGRVPLVLYEEFPYPAPAPPAGFVARAEPVEIDDWIAAASLYRSQVAALFPQWDAFSVALRAFAEARSDGTDGRYGVRYWVESDPR